MTSITIALPKQEKNRLARIAARYGLSLSQLSRFVLEELSEAVPMESLYEYENPIALKQSIRRGLRDCKAGRVSRVL